MPTRNTPVWTPDEDIRPLVEAIDEAICRVVESLGVDVNEYRELMRNPADPSLPVFSMGIKTFGPQLFVTAQSMDVPATAEAIVHEFVAAAEESMEGLRARLRREGGQFLEQHGMDADRRQAVLQAAESRVHLDPDTDFGTLAKDCLTRSASQRTQAVVGGLAGFGFALLALGDFSRAFFIGVLVGGATWYKVQRTQRRAGENMFRQLPHLAFTRLSLEWHKSVLRFAATVNQAVAEQGNAP